MITIHMHISANITIVLSVNQFECQAKCTVEAKKFRWFSGCFDIDRARETEYTRLIHAH